MADFLLSEEESQNERELAAAWVSFFEQMLKPAEIKTPKLLEEINKTHEEKER